LRDLIPVMRLSCARWVWFAQWLTIAIVGMAPVAHAGNWPQFRGPTGQGLAEDAAVPTTWDEETNILWMRPLNGHGHSSPVVWGNQVWVATASSDGRQLGAQCVDLATGELVREEIIFEPNEVEIIHHDNTYASPTPVIEEGRLYVDFGTYGAACLDTATGELLWENTDLAIDHQGGPGSSPVLFGDTLIVHRDGADKQYVAALDKQTGEIRWQRDRSAPYRPDPVTKRAFATPLLYEHEGRTLLISPAADQCHAYDAATGDELWHVRFIGYSTVPCPVAEGDHIYFCTGYYNPKLLAVRLGGKGNVTDTHVTWEYKAQVPEVPSPLVAEGRVYFISDGGVLTTLDALTGERIKVLRIGGNFDASPLWAGGHLYCCSREGLTTVVSTTGEPAVVSANKLADGIRASPAVVDGTLLIRTEKALYRIADPAQRSPEP
jgi:outer membrane protein assembly factor BamB